MNSSLVLPSKSGAQDVIDMNDARPRRWGWLLLAIGFGGFALWATFAPLDAGISASGTVVVSGNRKTVQPMAPGKITALEVKDGMKVTPGQLLVKLDDTQAKAQLDIARSQWFSSRAVEARLISERLNAPAVIYPQDLLDQKSDPRAATAMALQTELHQTRKRNLASEMNSMRETISGTESQIGGLTAARQAKQDQLALLQQELRGQKDLVADGFLARNRVSEQERSVAALNGSIAEDTGNLGRARQVIAEIKSRMISRQEEVRKEVESQLTDVQRDVASQTNRIQALQFDLANTEIRSPSEGIVVGLAVHTVGGVVTAAAPLMDIVPENERLTVDAQVPPHLIDKLHPGLDVDILFSAFQQSTTPHISGKVSTVSADVLIDPKHGVPYFKALVEVTPEGMKALRNHQIRAGMPADVFIRTGERTFWNYLFKPLKDRVRGSLTEQ